MIREISGVLERTYLGRTVSLPGEHKIAGKWFEVPQSIGSPHASFLQLAPSRLADLDRAATLECEELQRAQIESLFGLQRRAALRLMAPMVSASRKGSWRVAPQRLIEWLEGFEQEASEEEKRHRLVLQALHNVEAENRSLREELRRRGKPDPPSWTLKQEVFARNISSLPGEIAITPGMISLSFPAGDPAYGARLLHELSLAMVNDWTTFCRLTGSASEEDVVNHLLNSLEEQKQRRI